MGLYNIQWKKSAKKELRKLPRQNLKNILAQIESLEKNPFPINHKKIIGQNNTYRIRSGQYRIIYSVYENILTIEIIKVGSRQSIYQNL